MGVLALPLTSCYSLFSWQNYSISSIKIIKNERKWIAPESLMPLENKLPWINASQFSKTKIKLPSFLPFEQSKLSNRFYFSV